MGFILINNSAISSDLKCVKMLIYETINLLNYFWSSGEQRQFLAHAKQVRWYPWAIPLTHSIGSQKAENWVCETALWVKGVWRENQLLKVVLWPAHVLRGAARTRAKWINRCAKDMREGRSLKKYWLASCYVNLKLMARWQLRSPRLYSL